MIAPGRKAAGQLRWGVLSTASINDKVLTAAARSSEGEVVAVASRTEASAHAYAARWGIPTAHGTYDALLADDAVEAVYISVPSGLHHEWTMRALAAGKHVLVEKPYSRWPNEVQEAHAAAQEHGLVLSEAFMFRYHPQIIRLAEIVREGMIGELALIVSSFSWATTSADDIRWDAALGGGALLDVGVYCISIGRLLAGEPLSVTGHQVTEATGVDSAFVATMEFGSSVMAHFDTAIDLPDRSHLEVVGTEGRITVSDPWHCAHPQLTVNRDGEDPQRLSFPESDSYQLELEEFARAVRGEPHDLLGVDDALGQARAVEALFRAAATERCVVVDVPAHTEG